MVRLPLSTDTLSWFSTMAVCAPEKVAFFISMSEESTIVSQVPLPVVVQAEKLIPSMVPRSWMAVCMATAELLATVVEARFTVSVPSLKVTFRSSEVFCLATTFTPLALVPDPAPVRVWVLD